MTHYKEDILKAHRRAKTRRSSGLGPHRRRMYAYVSERSKGHCEMCRWGVGTDMHHVYGRGKNKDDWREQADSLLYVCRDCHPLPIQTKGFPSDEGGRKAEKALAEVLAGTRRYYG